MQDLFLVIGGELRSLDSAEFRDPSKIHIVGIFDEETAHSRWKENAQKTVDNAHMRYFVLPIGELIQNHLGIG